MKLFLILTAILTGGANTALANPACMVCTVAIGASLEIARALGISDEIVGLWAGAMFALLGYWLILWFDKKNWHFAGRDAILMLLSLSSVGFIYMGELNYLPKIIGIFYLDSFLFASILGALIYIYSQKFYQFIKARNHNHAHFPFEKVVLPVALLLSASLILTYYPL